MNPRFLTTAVLALGLLSPLKHASAQNKLTPLQKRLLSGFASQELDRTGLGKQSSVFVNASVQFIPLTSTDLVAYFPQAGNGQCKEVLGTTNVKVNQNCLNVTDFDLQGRGQANNNPSIAADPNNSNHLVVGSDDYRGGDRGCVAAYSLDNGVTWNDSTIPLGFTRGNSFGSVPREYWQVSGAPSVAWDSRHNVYVACLSFQRGSPATNNSDQSSAVYVFRSTQNNGASWNFAASGCR